MTTLTRQETAKESFDRHADAITKLLDDLAGDLGMHSRNFDKTGQRHWGYPGDLAHVEELLRQAHNFLTNIDED